MAMRDLNPSDGPAAFVGSELRDLRVAAGLTQQQLGDQVTWSASAIAMIERGDRTATPDLLAAVDDLLNANGTLTRLSPLLAKSRYPAHFLPWLSVEREAAEIITWELAVVPGLLQTEAYARAVLEAGQPKASAQEITDLVQARMDRRELLDSENRPTFLAIIDATVLDRPVGGPSVMAEQCEALLRVAETRTVHMQVLASDVQAHPGLSGSFALATTRDNTRVALLDNAAEGQVTTGPGDIDAVNDLLTAIRLEALPERASLQHIAGVTETWKQSI